MRKLALLVFVTLLPSLHAAGPAVATPLDPGACSPRSAMDVVRPASCQRIKYRVPLHVTAGDNLILFGPVVIERPREAGWVVRFEPGLEDALGATPPIEVLHLHHAVWISTAFSHPLFASGEEKTTFSIPDGFGIPVNPSNLGDQWLLNYMLHNQTPRPENVFITYEIDFIPAGSGPVQRNVEPYWVDVVGGLYPVYNTQRGFGAAAGECAFPRENCAKADPFGRKVTGNGNPGNGLGRNVDPPDGTIVFMAGHLHPGGLRLDLEMQRGTLLRKRVFTSDAVYFDPNGPVSWDMVMEVTPPSFRLQVKPGDRLVANSVYETTKGSWFEGMGIMITFIARNDTTGVDPFLTTLDPDDAGVTHGPLAEASNHGGPDRGALPVMRLLPVNRVEIGGFAYAPGGSGTYATGIPAVRAGETLTFVNVDAPAQIFHTVTSCRAPCDGFTGISYPLANGPRDFDSLELGYGPPTATAAANTAEFVLNTTGYDAGTYTYFCRIHPSMRGAFAVQ